jgi:hypothetical protein
MEYLSEYAALNPGESKVPILMYHFMKAYWRAEVFLHYFFTSALEGDGQSASQSGHFTLGIKRLFPI